MQFQISDDVRRVPCAELEEIGLIVALYQSASAK